MKYPSKIATGDAGEYFFAYKISYVLGWPCRLFDIDIGIDAQVEILDENRNSTGRFVAFQVKTSADEEPQPYWYVSKNQLDYWRDMDIPVFVALVSLKKQTIHLHQIKKKSRYHITEKDSVRIDFDLVNEHFTESSGKRIKAAAEESTMSAIEEHLSKVQIKIDEVKSAIEEMDDYSDPPSLIDIMNSRWGAYDDLLQAKTLSASYKVGAPECKKMEETLEAALNELRTFMEDWNMHIDWDDRKYGDGEIQKFIDEA